MAFDYKKYHQNRVNLLIHIVAVPVFMIGTVMSAWQLLNGHLFVAVMLLMLPVISLAVQGIGHKREAMPPERFTGPGEFIRRVFAEQFFRFWAFLFSGEWLKAFQRLNSDT